jgi:hypothetical protein
MLLSKSLMPFIVVIFDWRPEHECDIFGSFRSLSQLNVSVFGDFLI